MSLRRLPLSPVPAQAPGVFVGMCVCVRVRVPRWPLTPATLFTVCLVGRPNVCFLQLGMGLSASPLDQNFSALLVLVRGGPQGPFCWKVQGEWREG